MPFFVVQCIDHDDVLQKRLDARPAHLARLQTLHEQGHILAAGPIPKDINDPAKGFYGSTIIVEFDSREALDQWLADEPYVHAGVYKQVDVKPFVKVFPKDE
ncbi:hypothetical protein F4V57_11330 [Acinetobacter qingfengensis]|uniref:YCII-related domain-containing protein n=1 Tax=Acinetobacter qingfengensis TaxID=1262585 RepID=A0A1E7RF98_9GAMM|nr:YciI family protein [Acinetobacter qingfengensis]KAA8731833.1 hypothetical protein F4V57_11330 [Acinetobacter qingfengensis]OEY98044.1 hypothetical protein BJI46_00495 [Acinetobacter qingfengensis]